MQLRVNNDKSQEKNERFYFTFKHFFLFCLIVVCERKEKKKKKRVRTCGQHVEFHCPLLATCIERLGMEHV